MKNAPNLELSLLARQWGASAVPFGELLHRRAIGSNASGIVFGHHRIFITGGRLVHWGAPIGSAQTKMPTDLNAVLGAARSAPRHRPRRDFSFCPGFASGWKSVPLALRRRYAAGLDRVVLLAAGSSHVLAPREDGTVVAWGGISNVPEDLRDFVAIAGGFSHSLAVRSDGTVVAWGGDIEGDTQVPPTLII